MYGPADLAVDLGVSHETLTRLETHRALLETWSRRINLIGPGELSDYWRRHALDCAQLIRHGAGAKTWIDLGAGAGFPGLILAACLAETEGARVTLVESNHKKAAFLREAARAMAVPALVLNQRAEAAAEAAIAYQVVTARAFAPLWRIITYAKPILDRGAIGLFLKGGDVEAELAEAATHWTFQAETLPSLSDPRGRIVRVEGAERVGT